MKRLEYEKHLSVPAARAIESLEKNKESNKKIDMLYMFACCSKGLNEQGEACFRHIEDP